MFTPLQIAADLVYFSIYIVCLYFCLRASKANIPGLLYIQIMLFCGFVTEVAVLISKVYDLDKNQPYYFYVPLEYCLLIFFYAANTGKKLFRNALYASIGIYLAVCYLFIYIDDEAPGYPAAIYNASCFCNTVWITMLFFDVETREDLHITRLPLFWIYTALLIFFAGIFFFNGTYNYLLKSNNNMADKLRLYINTGLNYVLYSVLTYGFICSKKTKQFY